MKALLISIALVGVLVSPSSSPAATAPCLGAAPEAAGDAAALAAVRMEIEASCPCASFTGTGRQTHRDYLFCVNDVLKQAVRDETLRATCRGTARYAAGRSNCGYKPSPDRRPCVHTTTTGNVSCRVRPEKFCRGPRDAWCSTYKSCLNAADTNADHRVSGDDSGACNAPTDQNCEEQATLLSDKIDAVYEECVNVTCENPELDNFRCILGCISGYRTMQRVVADELTQPCAADRQTQCEELYAGVPAICTAELSASCVTNCNPLYPVCEQVCLEMIGDCTSMLTDAYDSCTESNR